MDYFTAVRIFVRIVETGSFARAAESLEIPKNTVTKLVQALEAHLRVKLLHRTTRKVSPTNDGALYFERMVNLLAEWYAIESELSAGQKNPHGRLRVHISSMASHLIIPALGDFRLHYPEMQLDVEVSDKALDMVNEQIDCVIQAGEIRTTSLIARHLGNLPFILCASPIYLAKHTMPAIPLDIENGHTLIHYQYTGSVRQMLLKLKSQKENVEIKSKYFISVNDINALFSAAIAGLGIVSGPAFMLQPSINDGKLIPLFPQWSSPSVPLHIIYPANRYMNSRTRVFVEWVSEIIKNNQYIMPPRVSK
ncbi:LysR family transcriptional regulator [Enterobacter cloacae]|uniref:LysR family transcriptional regulator n=3 Tax=Enterobacter cloacae TaxID=550 RepID=UPI001481DB15|nr:LysR family transcriptional regulator [Enterobacter cloacae]MDW3563479.1 LysR family transcriptional regulator [Enterobacter cloacae]WNJ09269.1 LysR family transcriptional regulator [Enterobacter cloacae]